VRIYLPVTLDELDAWRAGAPLPPRRAHAVTTALRNALPDEDEEGLEFAAQLAAADDALVRIASAPAAPHLRAVVSLDVPDALVDLADDPDAAPSAVAVQGAVDRHRIACAHVDEPAARADVAAAVTGDEAAVERLLERDLLWYDVTELGALPR